MKSAAAWFQYTRTSNLFADRMDPFLAKVTHIVEAYALREFTNFQISNSISDTTFLKSTVMHDSTRNVNNIGHNLSWQNFKKRDEHVLFTQKQHKYIHRYSTKFSLIKNHCWNYSRFLWICLVHQKYYVL